MIMVEVRGPCQTSILLYERSLYAVPTQLYASVHRNEHHQVIVLLAFLQFIVPLLFCRLIFVRFTQITVRVSLFPLSFQRQHALLTYFNNLSAQVTMCCPSSSIPYLLSLASILLICGVAILAVGFATDNWVRYTVDRDALKRAISQDDEQLTNFLRHEEYFSRTRGLWYVCFSTTDPAELPTHPYEGSEYP